MSRGYSSPSHRVRPFLVLIYVLLIFSLSLKNLIPVKFSFYVSSGPSRSSDSTPVDGDESKAKKEEQDPMCPSCKKGFSNNVLMFREVTSSSLISNLLNVLLRPLVMKPCAHVTCKTCTDSLVRPAKQCVVCDIQLNEKDIIELKREGKMISPVSSLHLLLRP